MSMILPSTLDFLQSLEHNNDKDWFNDHKDDYLRARANMADFARQLLYRMKVHDQVEPERPGDNLYRIYNDVRFHKHKPPFNPRFAGGFHRKKPQLRGGYYFQIVPGNSYVSCGFFGPNASDLQRIRQDIADNHDEWRALLSQPALWATFGKMDGEQLKTAPTGYPKNHPAVDLLRYKQFIFRHRFSDAEVLQADAVERFDHAFQAIRPFFDYMSMVLTTNANGESLI